MVRSQENTQDWTVLDPEDLVTVTEPGGRCYPAMVNEKTHDSSVIWIVDGAGFRRAFDHREGVTLVPSRVLV